MYTFIETSPSQCENICILFQKIKSKKEKNYNISCGYIWPYKWGRDLQEQATTENKNPQ